MVKIREAIVVEGRYDKNHLSQIVDAPIFETGGFQIMKDKALVRLLRQMAQKRGLIVLTDADGGGLVIRNYLQSIIAPAYLKHAYIPDIPGKERRKTQAGKEGKLGVEGMTTEVLLESLRRAGATIEGETAAKSADIIKQDLVEAGLSGGKNSSARRKQLLKKLQFPEHMSANAMLTALNLLMSREELLALARSLETEHD